MNKRLYLICCFIYNFAPTLLNNLLFTGHVLCIYCAMYLLYFAFIVLCILCHALISHSLCSLACHHESPKWLLYGLFQCV